MKFHTEVIKTIHGWKAGTLISEIPGVDKQLQIVTMKRSNGILCTTINAVSVDEIPISGGQTVQSVCIEWDDFKGPVFYHTDIKRVTQKSVRESHVGVSESYEIEQMNHPVIRDMIAHYKKAI